MFGRLVWYPQWLTLPIAVVAAVALVLTLLYARRRGARLRRVAAAAVSVPLALLVIAAGAVAVGAALNGVRPGYGFLAATYHSGWYSGGMVALAAAVIAAWGLALRRFGHTAAEAALAVWAWLAALGVLVAVVLPGGAYLFTWPVLAGCLALGLALRLRADPPWTALACCFAAVPGIILLLPVTRLLRQTFPMAAYPVVILGLLLLLVAPVLYLLAPRRAGALLPGAALVAAVVLLAGVSLAEPDPRHPRQVNLMYALDADRGRARWLGTDPAPAAWVDRYVTDRLVSVGARLPRYAGDKFHVAAAPPVDLPGPQITVLGSHRDGATRLVRLRVTAGGASRLAFYVDTARHTVLGARAGGVPIGAAGNRPASEGSWGWGFGFSGIPRDGLEVVLRVRGTGPIALRVVTYRTGLPQVTGFAPRPAELSWSSYAANRTLVAATFRI